MSSPIHILLPKASMVDEGSATVPRRLAAELRQHTDAEVVIREDGQHSDAGQAFLLLFDAEPSDWMLGLDSRLRQKTLARVVLLRCHRAPGMLDVLEMHGLAGGLENLRLRTWETHPDRDSGYGIAGLRTVVEQLGGECAPDPYRTDRYCIYESPTSTSLPQALAEYLTTLSKVRLAT